MAGLPHLPDPDRDRTRKQAVRARIVEVGQPERDPKSVGMCDARYPVRLAVDGDARLYPGERLQAVQRDSPLTSIVVGDASPGFASGVMKGLKLRCGKPEKDLPGEGRRLTTGAYDEASANRAIAEAQREHASRASQ